MNISFKLLENDQTIYKKILESLINDLDKYISSNINKVKTQLPNLIFLTITQSDTYRAIVSGDLRLELGILDPVSKVDGLLNIWSKNIAYNYTKPTIQGNKIKSNLTVQMIKSDFSDVLGSDYALVYDSVRGYSLPWLEWLLLDGQKTIIKNYEVIIGPNPRSRTGLAVMSESSKSWSVPSEFAGTISDNWITRSIDSAEESILNLFEEIFS
jgi:hypothetical protein